MSNREINREPVNQDEKGNVIQNVQSSGFVQDPTKDENTDITNNITIYYTDLDVENPAEPFLSPSEAFEKAQHQIRKFPNHIVEFYMYYYEEISITELRSMTSQQLQEKYGVTDLDKFKNKFGIDSSINLNTYNKNLIITRICKCIPGTAIPGEKNYRDVKRKNLKRLYDKIDFIRVYRPKNTIKWYTVSNEELREELAVIREFYGLINFPDKVGEYYFSKKISKWLATDELGGLLEFWGDDIPVIYVDELGDGKVYGVEHKTLLQIILEGVAGIVKGIGSFFKRLLGKLFDEEAWNNLWNSIMTDENHNLIPDNIDNFWSNITANGIKLFDFSWLDNNSSGHSIFDFDSGLQTFREWLQNLFKIGSGKYDETDLHTILTNKRTEIDKGLKQLKEEGATWWTNLANKIFDLLGINLNL